MSAGVAGHTHIASRVALVVLASAAIAWLVHDLTAVVDDVHAQAGARALVQSSQPSARRAAEVISQFESAASFNADPTPRIDEARFLLELGRTRMAARVLDGVVQHNSGNVVAWGLLATATAADDPARANQALQRLRALFGHPPDAGAEKGFLLSHNGIVEVARGQVFGLVESAYIFRARVYFIGWAVVAKTPTNGERPPGPADTILVVAQGRVIATGTPTLPRPSVARQFPGLNNARIGFVVSAPVSQLMNGTTRRRVTLFGAFGSIGAPLSVNCAGSADAFVCP